MPIIYPLLARIDLVLIIEGSGKVCELVFFQLSSPNSIKEKQMLETLMSTNGKKFAANPRSMAANVF